MKDLQREIVNQVASGKISAEEGAARLESLEAVEMSSQAGSVAAPAGGATKRVRVMSVIGAAAIVGEPSVTYAVAEGPHRARQDRDTMGIQQGPSDATDRFTFGAYAAVS